jgi:hypothetical protein
VILNFGVVDSPYSDKSEVTTSDVARILEDEYGVMAVFADAHLGDIAQALESSIGAAIENIMAGAPESNDVFGDATNEIEEIFKFKFLQNEEMAELGVQGVPTQASIDRKSSRFKGKKAKQSRPSFIDTGLYQTSFKAWVDQ